MQSTSTARPLPQHQQQELAALRQRHAKVAVGLLRRCLNAHCLAESKQSEYLAQIRKALDLAPTESDEAQPLQFEAAAATAVTPAAAAPSSDSKKPRHDEHNEVCEVCEKGGELLCCDTCNLVFHLECVRPKRSVIPKGRWSCAHCIVDGVVSGDRVAASQALRSMSRLARGVADTEKGDVEEDWALQDGRLSRAGEITIVRSGKRLIVRKTTRTQIVELDRYDTLEKALSSVAGGFQSSEEELWCMFCLDDPNMKMCAFCGCRSCFGKHDAEFLLLCDACNQESHTYCLDPPLTSIPSSNWFCTTCVKAGYDVDGAGGAGGAGGLIEDDDSCSSAGSDEDYGDRHGRKRHRKKKKAMGSSKKHKKRLSKGELDGSGGHDGRSSVEPSAPSAMEAVGVDAALAIVAKMAKREPGKAQLLLLDQLREWAPVGDLEAVLNALIAQRDALAASISSTAAGAGAGAGAAREEPLVVQGPSSSDDPGPVLQA